MLPASNRGVGMNLGFPDVCLTPVGPAVVPIPYPNLAMNVQAMPFSVVVMITMMNALNMASKILMTSGDEAGVAHPMMKQMGAYTMGNPIVFIEKMPGICLLCPTTGNNMNNPLGAVLVPSVTVVMYTRRAEDSWDRAMTARDLRALAEPASPPVRGAMMEEGVARIAIERFTFDVPSQVHHEMGRLEREGARVLIIDLRGNPGGEMDAFIRLADAFLPEGALILETTDADGDEMAYRARQGSPSELPLVLLVDGETASAAELFAGCLKAHGRATIVGETTYGKRAIQQILPAEDGRSVVYAAVAHGALPGETVPGCGVGITPDIEVPRDGERSIDPQADAQTRAALEVARTWMADSPSRLTLAAPLALLEA